ncbi:MAG: hypothetical protein U0350_34990 [Caldilineaceae bacterium]
MERKLEQVEQFFQAAQQAWEEAAQQYPPSLHCYRIGGLVMQLQIIGKALATRLTPALAHLAIGDQSGASAERLVMG